MHGKGVAVRRAEQRHAGYQLRPSARDDSREHAATAVPDDGDASASRLGQRLEPLDEMGRSRLRAIDVTRHPGVMRPETHGRKVVGETAHRGITCKEPGDQEHGRAPRRPLCEGMHRTAVA